MIVRDPFIPRALLIAFLVCCCGLSAAPVAGRQDAGPDPATSTERIEHAVRQAALASLLGDQAALARAHQELLRLEEDVFRQTGETLGLSDNVAWLAVIAESRPEGIDAPSAKRLLAAKSEPLTRSQIRAALLDNLPLQLDRLRRQDFYNRLVAPLNAFLRAGSGLLEGRVGPALRSAVDLVFTLPRSFSLSDFDRRRQRLATEWLDYPDLPDALRARLKEEYDRVAQQILEAAAQDDVREGREFQRQGELERARSSVHAALDINGKNRKALKLQATLERQWAAEQRRRSFSNLFVGEDFVGEEESLRLDAPARETERSLLVSLVLGDQQEVAQVFYDQAAGKAGAPEALMMKSTLADQRGRRDQALAALQQLAADYPETVNGRLAEDMLAYPAYNPWSGLAKKRRQTRGAAWRYALWGERPASERLHSVGRTLTTGRLSALENLGALTVLEIAVRALRLKFASPIPQQEAMAAAWRALDHPGLALSQQEQKELFLELARRAATMGDEREAMVYYELCGALTPRRFRKLRQAQARRLGNAMLNAPSAELQEALARRLVRDHPLAKETHRAQKLLAKLQPRRELLLELPRQWLREDPVYWRELGAPLELAWVDGRRFNGELADPAAVVSVHAPDLIEFQFVGKKRTASSPIAAGDLRRLQAAVAGRHADQVAIASFQEAVYARRLPFEIRGSVGGGGFEIYPRFGRIAEELERKR